MENYINLIGAILKDASPEYMVGTCGRYWLEVGGLDPQAIFEMWYRIQHLPAPPYKPLEKCPECKQGPIGYKTKSKRANKGE